MSNDYYYQFVTRPYRLKVATIGSGVFLCGLIFCMVF
jgi:hypothetical protein